MASSEPRKLQILFLLIIIAILVLSIGVGVHISGGGLSGTDDGDGSGGSGRYANMTDAQVMCRERAGQVFGDRIRNLVIDTHSSRLDQQAGLFKIFMEADIYPSSARQGTPVRHYINCFTRTHKLAIASFQFAKDGEQMQDARGSMFGF